MTIRDHGEHYTLWRSYLHGLVLIGQMIKIRTYMLFSMISKACLLNRVMYIGSDRGQHARVVVN